MESPSTAPRTKTQAEIDASEAELLHGLLLPPPQYQRGPYGPPAKYHVLTIALADKVAELLRAGNYFETALAVCGIARNTGKTWMARGRRAEYADKPEAYFFRAVQQARSEGEALAVARIAKAGQLGDWRADMARLERMYPERWGPKVTITVQNELQAFWNHLERTLDPDTLEKVADAIASYDSESMEGETGSLAGAVAGEIVERTATARASARVDPAGDAQVEAADPPAAADLAAGIVAPAPP